MVHNDTGEHRQFPRWLAIPLLALLLPLVLVFLSAYLIVGLFLHVVVWATWLPRGKSTFVVTSDSPIWSQYMTDRIIGVLGSKATVLNWSERSQWHALMGVPVMVFRYFGRGREFNPLAVVFKPLRPARVFRFWKPFKDYKHGRPQAVERLTTELLRYAGD